MSVAAVEREANKMARGANRASPLMETLGGSAITITYGGYRVIARAHDGFFRLVHCGIMRYRMDPPANASIPTI